jgi:uncharacterized low-complexity protein
MSQQSAKYLLTMTLGATALIGTMATTSVTASPFEMTLLNSGYQKTLSHHQDNIVSDEKCDHGMNGVNKTTEGKCGNSQCETHWY